VEPGGGSCKVVEVDDVEVEVGLGNVPATGTVGSVVVDVDVEVVVANVVVVGSPVIRTTGGCTVTATINRS